MKMLRSSTVDGDKINKTTRGGATTTTRDKRSMTASTMPLAPLPRPPVSPASHRSTKSNGAASSSVRQTSSFGSSEAGKSDNPGSPCSVMMWNFGEKHSRLARSSASSLEPPFLPEAQEDDDAATQESSSVSTHESILHMTMIQFGPQDARVGIATHDLAMVHLNNHSFDLADHFFSRAVHILEKSSSGNPMDVATSLLKLAIAKKHRHLYRASISALCDALARARLHLGDNHVVVTDMKCHLGYVYHDMGELQAALAIFQDCLGLYQTQSPDLDEVVAEMLCNIGSIQLRCKDYKEAANSFTRALHKQEELLGPCHPLVITTLDNVGAAHCRAKNYGSALKYYEIMLTAQTAHYGRWTMECCETIMKKNVILEKRKSHSAALKGTVTVLALQKQLLPSNHPSIQATRTTLERLEQKCRRSTPSCDLM